MDSEKLKQLKADIHQKIIKAINDSNIGEVLQEYDFIGDKRIHVDYTLDLSKIQLGDAVEDTVREILSQERVRVQCTICGWDCC